MTLSLWDKSVFVPKLEVEICLCSFRFDHEVIEENYLVLRPTEGIKKNFMSGVAINTQNQILGTAPYLTLSLHLSASSNGNNSAIMLKNCIS